MLDIFKEEKDDDEGSPSSISFCSFTQFYRLYFPNADLLFLWFAQSLIAVFQYGNAASLVPFPK